MKYENANIQSAYDMIYLAGCAANGIKPTPARIAEMDVAELYQMSERHSLSAIVYMVLEPEIGGLIPNSDLTEKWKQQSAQALRKNILLDTERSVLVDFMEQNGIWYMPLKGIVMQKYYPRAGTRQMADNDILFDEAYKEKIRDFFVSRGYIIESFGITNHDCYHKAPIYNFEMHRTLVGHPKTLRNYYLDVEKKLIRVSADRMEHRFSNEDFYIFMTVHEYKHYIISGHGLRNVLDGFLFLKKEEASMNWDYIYGELERIGLTEYERSVRQLTKKLFEDPGKDLSTILDEGETDMLSYLIFAGTYGTVETVVNNRMANQFNMKDADSAFAKVKYVFMRIFPKLESVEEYYPKWCRHRILLPFFYVYRLINRSITRFPSAVAEIKYLFAKKAK